MAADSEPAPTRAPGPDRALEVVALGGGLVAVATALAATPDWLGGLARFQILYVAAFAIYGIAVARLPRWDGLPLLAPIVMAVAVAARIVLLPVEPTLSDDVYRYLWEGRVLLAGGNPWTHAPADPALAPLRDLAVHARINHPELAAIYPPLGALGYALVASISSTVFAAKLWVVLHEVALLAIIALALRRAGASPARALVYGWCPLPLVEFAGTGHNDATALPWLALALVLAERRPVGSALALAAGVMVKLVPLLALPALWRAWTGRARVVAVVVIGVGLVVYVALTRGSHSGLDAFGTRWRHNELGFLALERLAGGEAAARAVAAALVAVVLLWGAGRGLEAWRSTQLGLRAAILLAPVVHPWYLAWNLALEPWSRSAPWLLLSCTAVLSYGVLRTPASGLDAHPTLATRAIEYGLPAALAIVLAVRARWRRRS